MRTRLVTRHCCVLALFLIPAAIPAEDGRTAAMFADWRTTHELSVTEFESHLESSGLAGVVQLHELLRTASDWQICHAEPFAVPPSAQWQAVTTVLSLLQQLRAEGVLGQFEVHSGHRDSALNQCAGGEAGSAHLQGFALDLTPVNSGDPWAALCRFWLEQGRHWNMGLGLYPSGRIHIDTWGYRTWGGGHAGQATLCTATA